MSFGTVHIHMLSMVLEELFVCLFYLISFRAQAILPSHDCFKYVHL